MENFKSGMAFFAINEFHFSKYEECTTSDEMFAAQEFVKVELARVKEELKNTAIDYGDRSSDEGDSEEERAYYAEMNRKMVEKEEAEKNN